MTLSILPASQEHWLELRKHDITSTDVAALLGCSPYATAYEVWHRKKTGVAPDIEPSDRMKWGTRLQDSIAHGIAEDQGWSVRRMDEYMRDDELRIGSSFDFEARPIILGAPESLGSFPDSFITIQKRTLSGDAFLLEIKNVDSLAFKEGWIENEDGTIEAPLHIELQVQHQLLVSGLPLAYIGALVGGNRIVLLKRERDEKVIAAIRTTVAEFWASIDANQPPAPDFQRDAEFIISLYQKTTEGKVIDRSGDFDLLGAVEMYQAFGEQAKKAEEQKDAAKARVLTMIGDAEKVVLGAGKSITASNVAPTPIEAHTRKGFRQFRINQPRGKR